MRELYADSMVSYISGGSAYIKDLTGIPQLVDGEYSYLFEDYSTQTINSKAYTNVYRLGALDGNYYFSMGNVVSFDEWIAGYYTGIENWISVFEHSYYTTGTTWSYDKNYFDLSGIYYMDGTNKVYIMKYGQTLGNALEVTGDMIQDGDLTLYLEWTPTLMEVKFYQYKLSEGMTDADLKAYTFERETEENGNTIYETLEYTLYVPFGDRISAVETTETGKIYLYSATDGLGNLEELMSVDKYDNPYGDSRYFRLTHWAEVDRHLYNSNTEDSSIFAYDNGRYSESIVGNVRLYPVFIKAYHVNFVVGNSYEDLLETEEYVIAGERFYVKSHLTTPINYLRRVKYIVSSSHTIMPENGEAPDTYQFAMSLDIEGQEVYVRIFFNLDMTTYVPVYTQGADGEVATAEEIKTITLNLNEVYYISDLFGEPEEGKDKFTNPDMAPYGNATFANWYLSNVTEYYSDDVAYLMGNYATDTYSEYSLNLSEISRLTLRQNGAKINILLYYLSGEVITVEMGDLMSVYAKIYNTNDLSIAHGASQYAHLNIARVVDAEGNEKGYINEDYFVLNSATKLNATGEGGYTKIQYTTVYNSVYTPVVDLVTNDGYNLSKVDVYNNYDSFLNNSGTVASVTPNFWSKAEGTHADSTNANFVVNINRTTEYPDENDLGSSYTKIKNRITINKLKNVNTNIFVLQVRYLSYDISFVYDDTKADLYYLNGNGGTHQAFSSNAMNVNLGVQVHYDGASYSTMNLMYSISNANTENATIKIEKVPYGTILNIFTLMHGSDKLNPESANLDVNTNLDYRYHFDSWGPTPTNIGFIDNTANTQRITPSDQGAGNTYVTEYKIKATILPNAVEAINFNVMYLPVDATSAWSKLWATVQSTATIQVSQINGAYTMLAIHKDLVVTSPSLAAVVGGTDITDILDEINVQYTNTYNSKIASTEGMGSVAEFGKEQLLNYFWFDEIWESLQDTETKKQYQLVNGKIYTKHGVGTVNLYGRLEDAIIAYFGQEIIDYLDIEKLKDLYDGQYMAHLNEAAIINNINRAVISDLSVGNSYITAGNRGYFALTPNGLGGFESIYAADGEIKTNIVQMYVKAPSNSQIEVEYTPMEKTATNNTYSLHSFDTGAKDCNAFGYDLDTSVATLNKQSYSVAEISKMFKDIAGKLIPELKLQAQFMIDVDTVEFYRSETDLIGSASIHTGYDEEVYRACVADGRQTLAERYFCTLENLRKVNRLPLFVIDPLVAETGSKNVFNHPSDDDNTDITYGNFSNIFDKWLGDGISNITTPITKTINLTADYVTTETTVKSLAEIYITYAINGDDSRNTAQMMTRTYYLARQTFQDCFGNSYTNRLSNLLLTNLNTLIANDNIYFSTVNTKFYKVTVDNTEPKYINGAVYAEVAEHQKYYSVPITYQVAANRRGVSYIADNVTITAIGGAINVSTDSSNSDITFGGVLLIGGDVNTNHLYRIKPGTFGVYTFGLWELTISYPDHGGTTTRLMDYCSHEDCTTCIDMVFAGIELSVNAHHNAPVMFSPDELDRGDFTVQNSNTGVVTPISDKTYMYLYDKDSTNSTGVRIGEAPDKENELHNAYFSIVSLGQTGSYTNANNEVCGIYQAEIRKNAVSGSAGEVLYTLTYTAREVLVGLSWIVSYTENSTTKAIPLKAAGASFEFLDLRNIHSVFPLSRQTDIKFVFTDGLNDGTEVYGVVTNLEDNGIDYLRHHLSSGKIFNAVNSTSNTQLLEGTEIKIVKSDNKYQIYNAENNLGHFGYVSINTSAIYLTNVRLQYKNLQGDWVDFEEGGTFAQPSVIELNPDGVSRNMYVRIACEWATYEVDFETVYRNSSDNGGLDAYSAEVGGSYVSVNLNNKTELMGSRINVAGENADKKTLKVFAGSTIEYSEDNREFTIKAPTYGPSIRIASDVKVGDYKPASGETYEYTLTGWVQELNTTGIVGIIESAYTDGLDINSEEFKSLHLTYIAWVEKSQDFKVSIDTTTEGYTHGHGKVTINRKTAIDVFGGRDGETIEYNYSQLVVDNGNTGYYALYRNIGKTNLFNVKIEESENIHQLISATFVTPTRTGTEVVTRMAAEWRSGITNSAYTFGTEIKVIFDAKDTLSNLRVYDANHSPVKDTNNNFMKHNLYGGYKYKFEEKVQDKVYTLKITDYWNVTKSYDYNIKTDTVFRKFFQSMYDSEQDRDTGGAIQNYITGATVSMTNTNSGKYVAIEINERTVAITFKISINYTDKYKNEHTGLQEYTDWKDMLEIKNSSNTSYTSSTLRVSCGSAQTMNLSLFANKGADLGGVLFNYINSNPGKEEYNYIFRSINEFMLEQVTIMPTFPVETDLVNKNITTKYNSQSAIVETVSGHPGKLMKDVEITYTQYTIQVKLTQRSTVSVSFGLSLPYATDYRNLQISTAEIPNNKKVLSTGERYFTVNGYKLDAGNASDLTVYNNALSNSKDSEGDVFMPSNFKIEPTSTVHLTATSVTAGTLYTLYINAEGNTASRINILQFIDDGTYVFGGIYIVEGSSSQYVSLSSESFSGTGQITSYSMWGATEHKTGLKSSVGQTHKIMGDTRIMLYFTRKVVSVTVDENIWTNNYDKAYNGQYFYENLNTNLVFSKKSSSITTYKLPSGLVGVVPATYNTSELFYQNTQYSYQDVSNKIPNRIAPLYANNGAGTDNLEDTWKKNGSNVALRLTYADSDLYGRIIALVNNKSSNGTKNVSATNYDAYQVVGKNMSSTATTAATINFNVELKGSTEWMLMNLPYGNTDISIAHYAKVRFFTKPSGASGNTTFPIEGADSDGYVDTLSSAQFTLRSTSYLPSIGSGTYSYTMQVAKLKENRLTNGMYISPYQDSLNEYGKKGVSGMNLNYTWTTTNAAQSPSDWKAYIKGYLVVYYNAAGDDYSVTYDNSSYFNPKGEAENQIKTISLSTISGLSGSITKVDIYPIWKEVRVYDIKFNTTSRLFSGADKQESVTSSKLLDFSSFNVELIEGETFTFSFAETKSGFGKYTMSKKSTTSKNEYGDFYTIKKTYNSSDVVLKGFALSAFVNDSSYRNVIDVASDVVKQVTGTYSSTSSSGITFKIVNVSQDITITPEWMKRGRTFTYEHNKTITISSELLNAGKDKNGKQISINQTAATLGNTSKTFVFALNYNRSFNALGEAYTGDNGTVQQTAYVYSSTTHPDEYFSIVKDANILKAAGDNKVKFTLIHDVHKFKVSTAGSKACKSVKITTCEYCTYYKYEETWSHTFSNPDNDIYSQINASQHWRTKVCDASGCPDTTYGQSAFKENHSWTTTKYAKCTETGTDTCKYCKKTKEIAATGHSATGTSIQTATCQRDAQYRCTTCGSAVSTGKRNHSCTTKKYYHELKSSASAADKFRYCGDYAYKCSWCNAYNSTSNSNIASPNNSFSDGTAHTKESKVTWKIWMDDPDPRHCSTGVKFTRITCAWCGVWLDDDFIETFDGVKHSTNWRPVGYYCKPCGCNVNGNGYDEVSNDVDNWYTETHKLNGEGGLYGYGPWIAWFRCKYTWKSSVAGSDGECKLPVTGKGFTWGTWYAFMRGDTSLLVIFVYNYKNELSSITVYW